MAVPGSIPRGSSRVRTTALRSVAIALTVAVTACRDGAAPLLALGAQYKLTSYAAAGLPYTWQVISFNVPSGAIGKCSDEITGGSLFFGTDGGVTAVIDRSLVCDGQADLLSVDTAIGDFTLSGSHLDLTLLGSLADLPGTGPYAVSAEIVGNEIRVEQTVAQTPPGAVTNRTTKTYTMSQ